LVHNGLWKRLVYALTLIINRDPEWRVTPHGRPVTNFSVAVNHRYTDP
jgi:hypothetical protein